MRLKKLVIQAVIASVIVIGFGLTAMTGSLANSYGKPSPQSIAFAKETTDILQSRLFAALGQEFSETTAASAPKATDAISLIFDDDNHSMRLVGTVGPLRRNDYPKDRFEVNAVNKAVNLQDGTMIDKVEGRYYRRSVPLSNFSSSCVLCHANYKNKPQTEIVGVLALKVPIK